MLKLLKIRAEKTWETIQKKPKQFFIYSMIILTVGTIYSIIGFFYKSDDISQIQVTSLPTIDNRELEKVKVNYKMNEMKMDKIVEELKTYEQKHLDGKLNSSDSIRAEYLYNEYQKLKNELKKN